MNLPDYPFIPRRFDVRPGIIKVTASGYAIAPAVTVAPLELGFQAGWAEASATATAVRTMARSCSGRS